MSLRYDIRHGLETDEPLIFNSLCSNILGTKPFSEMDVLQFKVFKQSVIEPVFRRSAILVASDVEDSTHIYGWGSFGVSAAVFEVIHFIYVRKSFRGHGIASDLARSYFYEGLENKYFTFRGRRSDKFVQSHGGVYAPHLLHLSEGTNVENNLD